ncbi:solute carrier family 25 member 45 isoform X6 [Gorilla gorilla gorilla]|uniref:solute carrier family 25 member 45 isoform X6 n=1 Tax=Gorilla gorilla gorilla TaxID=9595 RepID=UPI00300B380F
MPVEEFVAGWISGALGLVLGHPFDTVKVRLQTQTTYRGIVDCMVKIYRHESAYCLAPFDLIKVRLQNQTEPRAQPGSPPPRYQGPVHCAASIFREEGPRGLFRGAWALTLRDTPTVGIYFITYEGLCRQYTPEGQNPSSATVLVAGGFAGIASWVAATPLDVIKSRMQMDGLRRRVYQGMLDCMNPSVALITFRKSPNSFCPPGSSLPTRLCSPGVAFWTLNKLCSHWPGLTSSAQCLAG